MMMLCPLTQGAFSCTPESVAMYDLLIDPFQLVFAVDCEVEGDTLHCGALYASPSIPFEFIRLAGTDASIDVQLPDELRNQSETTTALGVKLPLYHHEPVQRSIST